MAKTNPGGRPCKNPGKGPADSVIYVYVTHAQYRECQRKAKAAGMSLSAWVEARIWAPAADVEVAF